MATDFRTDRLIVKRKQGASSSEISALQAQIGVTKVTTAEQFGIEFWDIPPGKVEETISAYENDPRFEYIEPDYIITVPDVKTTSPTQEDLAAITPQTTTPNDPYYPQLWGLNNTGQTGGTPDADIDAPEAWDIERGNQDLVIGVIDSGVDYNHPDLVANIWTNPGEIAGDGIDNDNNNYIDDVRGWDFGNNDNDPMDVAGHGTHVAGTIAGKGNNSVGVTGVAWNAKIMPLKFLDDSNEGWTSDAIDALNYARAKGVKLTNNSWGGPEYSQGLYDAINTAGQQGALFIAAAGNDSSDNDITPAYPASYALPNIISVASTDHNDALSIFTLGGSNYGLTSVDLGAPGSQIYSTTPGGNYASYSGTSMASPHVAGAAALVWSQNPTWTAQQVKNRLLDTTDPIPALNGLTVSGGRLNINNALGGSTDNPGNNPPIANPDTYSVLHDRVLYGYPGVLNNDTDSDLDLLVAGLVQTPSNGRIEFYPQGDFYYYPNPGFVGTDTFTYIVSDGAAIVPATVTINVTNNPPTATPDTYSILHDRVLYGYPGVLNNDTDSDLDLLVAGLVQTPTTKGSIALNKDGSFTYTPNAGFSGIAVDGWSNRTGPINLNIAPTPPDSAGTDKLTETANNTLKGEPGEDLLTGGTGAGTLILPFAESSVSASDRGTDLAIDKNRDPLTEGGAALDAASLFSAAADSPVPTLVKNLSPVFTEANGALVGTQPLAVNSEPFGVAQTSPFADPYLVGIYEARPLGI
jgi:subtilisin family serine protease